MITSAGLLFIEPSGPARPTPIIDEITRRMAAALRSVTETGILAEDGVFYPGVNSKGVHLCSCGAVSKSHDLRLVGGVITNSLAVHYLAHHRDEASPHDFNIVLQLPVNLVEPTPEELQSPR